MPQNLKELCRLLSRCKEGDDSQSSPNVTKALQPLSETMTTKKVCLLNYPLRSIHIHRPIGKVMIVLMGECGTGKSTTLHNLFNDGKSCEEEQIPDS